MTDAISRSAVLAIGNVRRVTEYDEAGYDMSYDAVPVEAIEALPAIDAVPVVRCKDCFYRGHSDCPIFLAPDEGFCHIGSLTGD